MEKKTVKIDILFIISMLAVLLFHLHYTFIIPFSDDETFYAVIPFRLMNGDSLIQYEWHLSQFSSLFSYLPVWLWTTIKGSTDGMILFLRFVYLAIHSAVAVVIYRFFRKYKGWALLAAIFFYIQLPYKIQAISYQSVFVIGLLLLSLCLLAIHEKKSAKLFIIAGISFGCCCVCNPFFAVVYVLYLILCLIWPQRFEIRMNAKQKKAKKQGKKITNKEKKELKKQFEDAMANGDNYDCFFSKDAVKRFSIGIAIIAGIAILFYFITGGSISAIFRNLGNLLGNSEYDITSQSLFAKLAETFKYFNRANLYMPFLLPGIFAIAIIDKKRRLTSHRRAYLFALIIWSIIFIIGCVSDIEIFLYAVTLPLFMLTTMCYLLTSNRNKLLFRCVTIPCLIGTVFQYLAANTHLAVIGVVLAVGNVAGVFFAMDLWKEVHEEISENTETQPKKKVHKMVYIAIAFGLCIQIAFNVIFYQFRQSSMQDAVKATKGLFSGLYMSQEEYDYYTRQLNDMDVIRSISLEKDPVFLASYNNWMYLYLDRPVATHSTWYRGVVETNQLLAYYNENPEQIPKYIYVESLQPNCERVAALSEMFIFTKEELSNGVLLTVEGRKF